MRVFLLSIFLLFLAGDLKSQVADSLKNSCTVDWTAEFIFQNPSPTGKFIITGSEYREKIDSSSFRQGLEIAFAKRFDIPTNYVATHIWYLISKQLNGEEGELSIYQTNYFLTRYINQPALIYVRWSFPLARWKISAGGMKHILFPDKGSQIFALQ